MSLVSALLVLGLGPSASGDPATPDPNDAPTLCDSGSATGLGEGHDYAKAYVPPGATIQFTATGTVHPKPWFAGYWTGQGYIYLSASLNGTAVHNATGVFTYYNNPLPPSIPFTKGMGSWTNTTGADASLLLDMWNTGSSGTGWQSISWGVNMSVTGGSGGTRPLDCVGMPLEQTYGDPCCGSLGSSTAHQFLTGRPVNTSTGSLYESFTDVALPGAGKHLEFTRAYNSLDATSGPMGPGWTFGYNASLGVDSGTGAVTVRVGDGKQAVFRLVGGTYEAPPGIRSSLTTLAGGGFRLTQPDQSILDFDASGRSVAMKDRLGVGLTFAYTGSKVTTITDAAGRELDITYTNDLLTRVELSDGRHVDYGYTSGRLTSVTDMRGKQTTYAYDAGGRLQSALDPNNHYLFQNTYDATTGRIASQLDGRGKQTSFSWDASGRTATVTDPRGHDWVYTYRRNVLLSSEDPLGNTTTYEYDDQLNRTTATDARNKTTTMTYDADGNMLTRTGPAPSSVHEGWTYTSFNAVATYTNGRNKTTSYEYFANQLLKKKTDPLGRETSYTWTANGLPDTVTDPRGKVLDFGYDAAGNRTSMLSPEGNLTTYGYDGFGRKTSEVEPRGNVSGANPNDFKTTYEYNAGNQVTKVIDPLGHETVRTYDDAGNLQTVKDADLKVTTYEYDADNKITKVTDPRGGETATTYDDNGNVASVTTPAGTTSYTYDDANRRTTEVTPRGNVSGATTADFTWTYTYDPNGNRLTESNPTAGTTATAYDELNRPSTVTDAHSKTTTTAYDANGNVVSVTDPLTRVFGYGYDDADQQISMTDPKGKITTYGYNASGNKTSETSPLGNIEKWTYDGDGQLATQIDPRGNVVGGTPTQYTTTYAYDPAGHLASVTDPLSHATSYGYDRAGNLVTRTDARNNTTTYTYDVVNRLKTVKDPLNNTTTYGYDAAGNVTSRTDANSHATSYTYDLAGRLTQKSTQVGAWNYDYDAAGNLTKTETAAGAATGTAGDGTITQSYDPLDRLIEIDYSDSTPHVAFGYDEMRRTSMTDNAVAGAASETYTYDDAGQLTGITRGTASFTYAYDDDGRLTSRTVPDGRTITQTWDDDSRSTGVSGGGVSTAYTYDAAGNRTGTTFGNGITETRAYDAAGQLSDLTTKRGTTIVSGNTFTRDANGNPTKIVRAYPGTQGENYTYDENNRVTSVCWSSSCTPGLTSEYRYTYDPVGNRLTEFRRQGNFLGTITYDYNAKDQLTHTHKPAYGLNQAVDTNYTYDANGNQITAGGTSFTYDLENRVKTSTASGTATTYTYDGEGARLSSTTGANSSTYSWDKNYPLPELATETFTNGTSRKYLDDPAGDPIAITNPGSGVGTGIQYLHPNGNGSISAVTDSTNARQATYNYEPFGPARVSPTNQDNVPNPIRYASEYLDSNSNRYHLRARDYDPATGRFNSLDPRAQDITDPYVSEYIYANNQPTVLTDPSGECPMCVGFAAGFLIDLAFQVGTNVANGCDPFYNINWTEVAISAGLGAITAGLAQYLRTLALAIRAGRAGSGVWGAAAESMSARAAAYQAQITGRAEGMVYRLNGVKFDGFAKGVLQEAKGPGLAKFVRNGQFRSWFRGADAFVAQAQRQLVAARGIPIIWSVAEAETATAIRNLFLSRGITGIKVVHIPVG